MRPVRSDAKRMTLFVVSLTCGILELWLLLFFWGFSAGPTNAAPFIALVGCFTLLFAAAPLALFFERISGLFGMVGAALTLTWPVAAAFDSSTVEVFVVAVLPSAALGAAAWRLWRTRQIRWLAAVSTPPLWVRAVLAGLPVALFVMLFNAKLILAILLTGPPK